MKNKKSRIIPIIGKEKKAKELLLRKITHNNLEKKIRQQTDELEIRDGQLRQGADRERLGADREKLAEEKARQQTNKLEIRDGQLRQGADREKLGADRERLGADRERLGADREKLAEEKARQQMNKLEIRDGQLRQGADREKLGADRERLGANRERLGADRERLGADREKFAEEQIHIRTMAMESTLDGIFIIDVKNPDFPIIYANPSFYSLSGYAKKEVIGKNYFLLYRDNADLRVVEEIKQTMRHGKSFHGEMLNFKRDGKKFWSSLRIAPIRNTKGDITHYVVAQTDITLMKKRELEIEEQREDLLHVTRVGKLAEFVSSLAHEISQPLTAILSYAQAAQRLLKNREPQVQEILQYIIHDDQRAAEVISRLRYLLKKSKPTFEPLDINVLIKDTVDLIMTHITIRNKVVKFELDRNLPLIHGDQIQLQQVLLNLISNSLEAMDESSDSCELSIRTSRKDTDTILVQVKDSGCGIPEENMKKLFAHFFTSKPDGLGMGLSISRSIVEAHGGRLDAENNPDRGATFYFTLPIGIKENT